MRPLDFRVTTAEFTPGAYVVTLAGELDVENASRVDGELARLDGARHLVVDLLEVPFVDSTVVGVLLKHARRARMDGSALVLVSDDPRVLRTFEVTGLSSQFQFERTLGAAIGNVLEEIVR